ncbi:MAG: iron hydrogenase small subunit, partial [Bacteroidales bacterium]|nr:iron hydrogenase small subunit [Bacteroidales bacterium]
SVTPCTAAKNENTQSLNGIADLDFSITTRELVRMIRQSGIDIQRLDAEDYEPLMSEHSGASIITEVSGGTTEAVIRTLGELITGNELDTKMLKIMPLRSEHGIKETILTFSEVRTGWEFLKNQEIRFAVVNGSRHAMNFFEQLKENKKPYHFAEVMVCQGGCIGGGGQPIPVSDELIKARAAILYSLDEICGLKKAHENARLNNIYREFLTKTDLKENHKILYY